MLFASSTDHPSIVNNNKTDKQVNLWQSIQDRDFRITAPGFRPDTKLHLLPLLHWLSMLKRYTLTYCQDSGRISFHLLIYVFVLFVRLGGHHQSASQTDHLSVLVSSLLALLVFSNWFSSHIDKFILDRSTVRHDAIQINLNECPPRD